MPGSSGARIHRRSGRAGRQGQHRGRDAVTPCPPTTTEKITDRAQRGNHLERPSEGAGRRRCVHLARRPVARADRDRQPRRSRRREVRGRGDDQPDHLRGGDLRRRALRRAGRTLVAEGADVDRVVFELTTDDVRNACDILAPVAARTADDGRVSIEVEPTLANDTDGDHRLREGAVGRCRPSQRADQDPRHPRGAAGDHRRDRRGHQRQRDPDLLDRALPDGHGRLPLRSRAGPGQRHRPLDDPRRWRRSSSRGSTPRSTSASTRSAPTRPSRCAARPRWRTLASPTRLEEVVASDRWQALAAAGANPQRPLWASTGVKNPDYPDTLYVTDLVVADTVNTMPEKTLLAFADHGEVSGDQVTGRAGRRRRSSTSSARSGSTSTTSSEVSRPRASTSSRSHGSSCWRPSRARWADRGPDDDPGVGAADRPGGRGHTRPAHACSTRTPAGSPAHLRRGRPPCRPLQEPRRRRGLGALVELAREVGLEERRDADVRGRAHQRHRGPRGAPHRAARTRRHQLEVDGAGHRRRRPRRARAGLRLRRAGAVGAVDRRHRPADPHGGQHRDRRFRPGAGDGLRGAQAHRQDGIECRFISNIDPTDAAEKLSELDPATTLFIVASKTFGTLETLTNARLCRSWLLDGLGDRRCRREALRRRLHRPRQGRGVRHRPGQRVRLLGLGRWPLLGRLRHRHSRS